MTQLSGSAQTDELHATASRKAARHLMPLLCLVYFMAFVDRTNVGLAKSSLETDLASAPPRSASAPGSSSSAMRCSRYRAT